VRLAVTPAQIGLCGCWQIIAVRREREVLDPKKPNRSDTVAYYASSCLIDEHSDEEMHERIRAHWSAIENGVHHRRDVTFGEDACRVADRKAGHALATMRNLAIGMYELKKHWGQIDPNQTCASWRRSLTFSQARELLKK